MQEKPFSMRHCENYHSAADIGCDVVTHSLRETRRCQSQTNFPTTAIAANFSSERTLRLQYRPGRDATVFNIKFEQ